MASRKASSAFVALFRGSNVGGKNRLAMPDLRRALHNEPRIDAEHRSVVKNPALCKPL